MDKQAMENLLYDLMEVRTRYFHNEIPKNMEIGENVYFPLHTLIQKVTQEIRVLETRARNYDLFSTEEGKS